MSVFESLLRRLAGPTADDTSRRDLGWTPALRRPSRPVPADPAPAITAFWAWWSTQVDTLTDIENEPLTESFLHGLLDHLQAIHRDLAWEIGPGVHRKNALTVSPDGVSGLRTLTARWKAAAAEHADWEFHDTRPAAEGPANDLTLQVGAHEVVGRDVEVAVFDDQYGHRMDVWIYHPVLAHTNRRQRWQIAFLLVDAALGESDLASWLRTITPSPVPLRAQSQLPPDPIVWDLDGLRRRVHLRIAQGDPAPRPFAQMGADTEILPRARRWLFPTFDQLADLTVPDSPEARADLDRWLATTENHACLAARRIQDGLLTAQVYHNDPIALERCVREHAKQVQIQHRWDPNWSLAGR